LLLPVGFDSHPSRLFKSTGEVLPQTPSSLLWLGWMRAFDWLLFAQVLAGFAMRDCMDPILLHVFLRFTECISRLVARDHVTAEPHALQLSVVGFLGLFLRRRKTNE